MGTKSCSLPLTLFAPHCGSSSGVDVASMPHAQDLDFAPAVVHGVDHAVVADAYAPQIRNALEFLAAGGTRIPAKGLDSRNDPAEIAVVERLKLPEGRGFESDREAIHRGVRAL